MTYQDELCDLEVQIRDNLEEPVVADALARGLDLRKYADSIEEELRRVEGQSVAQYVAEAGNIATLHRHINASDSILERMESMLQAFQHTLSNISSDIQTLQDNSVTMSHRLRNRQAVRGELSQFIDEMLVPKQLIDGIMKTAVTEREFIEQLHELHHKITYVKQQAYREARSCADVKEVLEQLTNCAVLKTRHFLLQRIYAARKPMSNYQLPKDSLIKHRFFQEFLMHHDAAVAREVKEEYRETMNKIYFAYFKEYYRKLLKLQYEEQATKDDLLAVEDAPRKNIFSLGKSSLRSKASVFALGNRGAVLGAELESAPIVPSVQSDQRLHYETIFRSVQSALRDVASTEHQFLRDFFLVEGNAADQLFDTIMAETLEHAQRRLESHVAECYDALGLFLCAQIVHKYKVAMEKERETCLNYYWASLTNTLVTRFHLIMQLHLASLRDCDPEKLSSFDTLPHYISRRYAEFAGAILSLNDSPPLEAVAPALSALQAEVCRHLQRMAAELPDHSQQLLFLMNNLDMIIAILQEKGANKEAGQLQEKLDKVMQDYTSALLTPYFGALIAFVREVEPLLEKERTGELAKYEPVVGKLISEFNSTWKPGIESVCSTAMTSFANFKMGTEVFQTAVIALLQYYERFTKLLTHAPFSSLPARSHLINHHKIKVELKKYKPQF